MTLSENNLVSVEARLVEPIINYVRALAGNRDRTRRRTPLGIEEWQSAHTGGLMIREMDVAALTSHLEQLGFTLEKRVAGQFTELYTRLPFKRFIHAFNLVWFRKIGWPHLALGNLLIFRKVSSDLPSIGRTAGLAE